MPLVLFLLAFPYIIKDRIYNYKIDFMPKVYVTQVPVRKNIKDQLVPAVNINTAMEYGDIEIIFPGQFSYANTSDIISMLHAKLQNYNEADGDVLLPLGDPGVCAMANGLLAQMCGSWTILKWDKNAKRYFPTSIDMK